jgi:hypothetical protein
MTPEERERVSAAARHRRAVREKNKLEEAERKRRGRANRAYYLVYEWAHTSVGYRYPEDTGRFITAMLALGAKGDRLWGTAEKAIPREKKFPAYAAAAWMAAYCGHDPQKILTIAKLLLPGKVKA